MTVKYSNSYDAKRKRIQRLPELWNDMMLSYSLKNAETMIREFQQGIKRNNFGLDPLTDRTKQQKRKKGYSNPNTPLYGGGDDYDESSYINMLRIKRLKNGYKVFASWKKHHESDLKLRDLFIVHEYGTSITMPNGTVIKIPARPAFLLAYRRMMSKMKKAETSIEVRKAITEHINNSSNGRARKFIGSLKSKYEEQ